MRSLSLCLLLLLTSCFAPQQVELTPVPKVTPSTIGKNTMVAIDVADHWSQKGNPIGYWGKPGSTSAPLTTKNLEPTLQKALADALRTKGFNVVGGHAARAVHATLVDFDYRNDYSYLKVGMHANVEMEVHASNGKSDYTRLYSTHVERWWYMAPSEKKNEKYLSKALAELVEQVAADQQLMIFLATP